MKCREDFKAVRTYQDPPIRKGIPRAATDNEDDYEDAVEIVRGAISSWNGFLLSKSLIQEALDTLDFGSRARYSRHV